MCGLLLRCSLSLWMRAIASPHGCLQRMLGFQALTDLTQSVRSYLIIFYAQISYKHSEVFNIVFVLAVNLGGLLLQALLEFWPRTRINPMDEEENEVNHGKEMSQRNDRKANPPAL